MGNLQLACVKSPNVSLSKVGCLQTFFVLNLLNIQKIYSRRLGRIKVEINGNRRKFRIFITKLVVSRKTFKNRNTLFRKHEILSLSGRKS